MKKLIMMLLLAATGFAADGPVCGEEPKMSATSLMMTSLDYQRPHDWGQLVIDAQAMQVYLDCELKEATHRMTSAEVDSAIGNSYATCETASCVSSVFLKRESIVLDRDSARLQHETLVSEVQMNNRVIEDFKGYARICQNYRAPLPKFKNNRAGKDALRVELERRESRRQSVNCSVVSEHRVE